MMSEHYRLALLGFGNVGQAFARLLQEKQDRLKEKYDLTWQVTGIATGSHGIAVDPQGIDVDRALEQAGSGGNLGALSTKPVPDSQTFIRECGADALFETIPVNYDSGQPALDFLRLALEEGMHAVTANKGPVVHGYRQLKELARQHERAFLFESTVMDGAPVFSIHRCGLPGAQVTGLQGILNSTTNFILSRMEDGDTQEEAIRRAQEMGIAETDPSGDVDGWDAAVKVAALVTVLMDIPLTPQQVERQGIGGLDLDDIRQAWEEGKRWKLVCSAERDESNQQGVKARVSPQMVPPASPLYGVTGTSAVLQLESDVLGRLTLSQEDPTPMTTAYGLLADFLNAVRG